MCLNANSTQQYICYIKTLESKFELWVARQRVDDAGRIYPDVIEVTVSRRDSKPDILAEAVLEFHTVTVLEILLLENAGATVIKQWVTKPDPADLLGDSCIEQGITYRSGRIYTRSEWASTMQQFWAERASYKNNQQEP